MSLRYVSLIFMLGANPCAAGPTAEQVLGEYWKDPLFGEAAADITIPIEILSNKLWPESIAVSKEQKIRFVFLNKSEQLHLIAFSTDVEGLLNDQRFQAFITDEVNHLMKQVVGGANHSHANSSIDDAAAIVKSLDQRPTVLISPDDKKEILIRFDEPASISVFCVLDKHQEHGFLMTLEVRR